MPKIGDDAEMPSEETKLESDVREAFRAGWYVNAAVEDQPQEYLEECEDVDWKVYSSSRHNK